MSLTFDTVQSEQDIADLARIANEIWSGYWPDIIGEEQTAYMIDRFQSTPAISTDIKENHYVYWFLRDEEGTIVGYTSSAIQVMNDDETHNASIHHSDIVDESWPKRLFISKIYLYPWARGKHYASEVIRFYEQYCKDHHLPAMYLTVNRNNTLGFRAYTGRGFETLEEVDAPIGNGFFMNDYIMAKRIEIK